MLQLERQGSDLQIKIEKPQLINQNNSNSCFLFLIGIFLSCFDSVVEKF
jgi:hypothetical protein